MYTKPDSVLIYTKYIEGRKYSFSFHVLKTWQCHPAKNILQFSFPGEIKL